MEKIKKAYLFDKNSKELIQEARAYLNPRRSRKEKKPVFSLPASCTFTAPPAKKPETVLIFNEEKNRWDELPDVRGVKFFDIDSKEPYMEKKAGVKPAAEKYTRKPPPSDYHQFDKSGRKWQYKDVDLHILDKWREIEAALLQAITERFEYNTNQWVDTAGLRDLFDHALLCKDGAREWKKISLLDTEGAEIVFKEAESYIDFYHRYCLRNINYVQNANKLAKILQQIKKTDFKKKPENTYFEIKDFEIDIKRLK